jgi:phosphoglycerol transferase
VRRSFFISILTGLRDWRAWLVALSAALIWVAHFDRWTLESWRIPTDYYDDAHETLARLKAASEGDVLPFQSQVISRLGAPFGAHWNAYPAPDKPLMLALGALVHLIGLYAAANVGFLLAQITSALAFYFVARWLRCRWEWAAAGGLLFAYTYHTFHRGLAHFSLIFTWTVPLGLLAVWLVAASRRVTWRRPVAISCLFSAAAIGASNPYNLYFWLQLIAWAIVWQWFGARRRENLQLGFVTVGVALATFALLHVGGWLHVDNPDAAPLLARNYGGTEVYALKPVEMFIPPPFHHWDWLAFFGHRYTRWSVWRGEVFLPYLGLAGIAGFIWLAVATVRRLIARRAPSGSALSIAWILSYATIGGLTNVLALFAGFLLFRATNRAAVFVSAIVLFFLVGRLSRLSLRWPNWLRVGAATALTALGVFEQIPKPDSANERAEIAAAVRADQEFGRTLEHALPTGAMVFQLPVLGFPEVQAPNRLGDYEHFRPYLATEHLRFSYGAPKSRSRSRWQHELGNLPTAELVTALERDGFSALYLNRKGYADGGEKILRELATLGYTDRLQAARGNQVVIKLRPAVEPTPPLAQSMTYGQGWQLHVDDGWHWAYDDAALAYYNPYPQPITVDVKMTVMGATPRELILDRNGESVAHITADTSPKPMMLTKLLLAPGVNRFKLRSTEAAVRQGPGRNQLRSFGLHDAEVIPRPLATAGRPAGKRFGAIGPTKHPTTSNATPLNPNSGSMSRVAGGLASKDL